MRVPDVGFPVEVVGSVPAVAAPDDIDITNTAGLRAALLRAAARGHGTFVVDMGRTRFCDTAGTHTCQAPGPNVARETESATAAGPNTIDAEAMPPMTSVPSMSGNA
jgi:hypothetical protein